MIYEQSQYDIKGLFPTPYLPLPAYADKFKIKADDYMQNTINLSGKIQVHCLFFDTAVKHTIVLLLIS